MELKSSATAAVLPQDAGHQPGGHGGRGGGGAGRGRARGSGGEEEGSGRSRPEDGGEGEGKKDAVVSGGGGRDESRRGTAEGTTGLGRGGSGLGLGLGLGLGGVPMDRKNSLWERISVLKEVLGSLPEGSSLPTESWPDSPAKILREDEHIARAIIGRLSEDASGQQDDPLCRWLYETFQTRDPELQIAVLRYIPALCSVYLPRIACHANESLAGFEAVLLALYACETKARNGCPIIINIPDLSQPSLYHSPRTPPPPNLEPCSGQSSIALGPQDEVKATKRAIIVGVALELFGRRIASMPPMAKLEACQCALRCAALLGQPSDDGHVPKDGTLSSLTGIDRERVSEINGYHTADLASCRSLEIEVVDPKELFEANHTSPSSKGVRFQDPDAEMSIAPNGTLDSSSVEYSTLESSDVIVKGSNGTRIHLPWEMIQPLLKILSHCLLAPLNPQEVKDAASIAVKALYKRAVHDVLPEAILATRSLMRLEAASKSAVKTYKLSGSGSSTSTPSKQRKPEIFLVSK